MSLFITFAIEHARLTLATLAFLLTAGLVAYVTIPKEAEPDVKVPIIYVQLTQRGIGVLITDHSVRETLSLVDRAYLIHGGTVMIQGRPEAIMTDPEARRVYLGERFSL